MPKGADHKSASFLCLYLMEWCKKSNGSVVWHRQPLPRNLPDF